MPIIFPHELAVYLAEKGMWPAFAPGEQGETEKFWQHLCDRHVDWATDPANLKPCPRPLGVYGDDVQYNKEGDKLAVFGWNDVLQKTFNMHNWPIFVLRAATCRGCGGWG